MSSCFGFGLWLTVLPSGVFVIDGVVFQAAVEDQLNHMQSQIQALRLKAGKSSDNVKREFNKTVRTLEKQKKHAYQLLDDLDRASTQTWRKVKASLSEVMDQLKQSFQEAMSSITE